MKATSSSRPSAAAVAKRWQRRSVSVLVWLAAAGASLVHAADHDGRSLVTKMLSNSRHLNYEGTFVYIRGTAASSLKIFHKSDDRGERERLVALSGSAKEVVRDKGEVQCFFPGERSVMVEKSQSPKVVSSSFPRKIHNVSESYDYSVLGGDRVVARPTWVVKISPKESDRYSYRIWIDTSTHLMLKSEVLGTDGNVLEQVLFTTLEFPREIPDASLQPSVKGEGYSWHKSEMLSRAMERGSDDRGQWRVNWLPSGFTLHDRRAHTMHSSGEPVDQIVYSDGLAAVSIFVEKAQDPTATADEISSFGAVNTYRTLSGQFQVTLVGELPVATLKRLAAAVAPPEHSQ